MQPRTSRKVLTASSALAARGAVGSHPLSVEDREAGVELLLRPVTERAVKLDPELQAVVALDHDDRVRVARLDPVDCAQEAAVEALDRLAVLLATVTQRLAPVVDLGVRQVLAQGAALQIAVRRVWGQQVRKG